MDDDADYGYYSSYEEEEEVFLSDIEIDESLVPPPAAPAQQPPVPPPPSFEKAACSGCTNHGLCYALERCRHRYCRLCLVDAVGKSFQDLPMMFTGITCPDPGCACCFSRQELRSIAGFVVLDHLDNRSLETIEAHGDESVVAWRIKAAIGKLLATREAYVSVKVETVSHEIDVTHHYYGLKKKKTDHGSVDVSTVETMKNIRKLQNTKNPFTESVAAALKEFIDEITKVEELPYVVTVLLCRDAGLRTVINWLLRDSNTMEMVEKSAIYFQLFELFRFVTKKTELFHVICTEDARADVWLDARVQKNSIMDLFQKLFRQACVFMGNGVLIEDEAAAVEQRLATEAKEVYMALKEAVDLWKEYVGQDPCWFKDANEFFAGRWPSVAVTVTPVGGSDYLKAYHDAAERRKVEDEYVAALKPHQFRESLSLENTHFFRNEKWEPQGGLPGRARRISKEVAGLITHLPLEYHSSIHVRVLDWRSDLLRVLIIGPQGTPYQDGIFLFDVFLGDDYPYEPPKMQFLTTGGGKVRFNPNLYDCGKVCLSLLGTWTGPSWIPATSTLLQVLISIQSLVLVEEPYYNEPAYNPPASGRDPESEAYNQEQRINTLMYSMVPALESPDESFREVIETHFRLKRHVIEQTCDEWLKEKKLQSPVVRKHYYGGNPTEYSYRAMKVAVERVKALLAAKFS